MTTAYCIDVSGSICQEQLARASDIVRSRYQPGDVVIAFDDRAKACTLDHIADSRGEVMGRRGSDPTTCFEVQEAADCNCFVLIGDGLYADGCTLRFNDVIEV